MTCIIRQFIPNFERHDFINYLMVSVIALVPVTIFINYKTIKVTLFSLMAFVILLFDVNFLTLNYLDTKQTGFLPFEALLGPMLFLHIKMFNGTKVSLRQLFCHLSPVLALLFFFLYLVLEKNFYEAMSFYYLIIFAEGISMLLYGLYALFPTHTQQSIALRNIVSFWGVAFIINSLFTIMYAITILTSKKFDVHHLNFVNNTYYSVFVFFGWVYFFSSINMMIHQEGLLYPSSHYFEQKEENQEEISRDFIASDIEQSEKSTNSYKKGRLSDERLLKYKQKLNELMEKEQLYLNSDLTLSGLSKVLKISNHHLTQVLSISIGSSFYTYINNFRIEYAITLIKNKPIGINLSTLALNCGFNNQASFNRYFKEIAGLKPSVYIKEAMQKSTLS